MRIGKKLGAGFGAITATLVVVAAVAIFGLYDARNGVGRYREVAAIPVMLGRVQFNMLEAQLALKDFVAKNDAAATKILEERVSKANGAFAEADAAIVDPDKRAKLVPIRDSLDTYAKAVPEVLRLRTERDRVVGQMAQLGESMSNDLDSVLDAASRSGNASLAAAAGRALGRMLKGRVGVLRFLSNNDPAAIDKASELAGKSFAASLEELRLGLDDDDSSRLLEKLEKERQQYLAGATSVRRAVLESEALMTDVLDKVGPRIAAAADELKRSIRNEQNELGVKVDAEATTSMTLVGFVALIALLGSVVLAKVLTKAIGTPIVAVANAARQLARGELDGEIAIRQKDEVGQLADSFRTMQAELQEIATQTRALVDATDRGQLAIRADATRFEGAWRRTIDGLNRLADAYAAPIRVTSDYVARIAKGDIPPKIADTYQGDFNAIKDNLNCCIDAVQRLRDDARSLIDASVEGRLDYRADAARHEGEYARIVSGVNRVVDVLVGHLDALPTPAMVIGPDFTVRYMNDTGSRLLGRAKRELVGSKCYDQFKTSDCHTDKCACGRAMRSGVSAASETDAHPNGASLDIAYSAVPLRDEGGAVIGAFEVVTDQTEIKQAARATERAAALVRKQGAFQTQEIEKLLVNLDKVAHGDLDVALGVGTADADTAEVAGNFERINAAVQSTVDALQALIADANRLAHAGVAGELQTRADGARHRGEYRRIVEGMNATLDAIVAPVSEAAAVLERLADYDLSARMQGHAEGDLAKIKESLNKTAEGLHEAIAQVNEAVGQVASAAEQIAAGSQAVALGASEQASSLEETSSALEEMTGQTKQNADNTQQARAVAKSTRELAVKGGAAMGQMVSAMTNIRQSAEDTSAIIKDINEIAFQTNLLALNAAVEAARAGDAGRGFAVVAEEVRNLALRAKEAANKTESLIAQSAKLAHEGEAISGEVNGNLTQIVDSIGKVADFVEEVALASEEQAKGIAQVNKAVAEMDKVVQQAAATSEESSSAAEELASQSQELSSMVGRFRLSGEAAHGQLARPAKVVRMPSKPKTKVSAGGSSGTGRWPSQLAEQLIPLDEDEALMEF